MTMKKDGIQTRNRKIARKAKKCEDKHDTLSQMSIMPPVTTAGDFGLAWPSSTTPVTSAPTTSVAPPHQNVSDSQIQQMMYYNQLGYFQ